MRLLREQYEDTLRENQQLQAQLNQATEEKDQALRWFRGEQHYSKINRDYMKELFDGALLDRDNALDKLKQANEREGELREALRESYEAWAGSEVPSAGIDVSNSPEKYAHWVIEQMLIPIRKALQGGESCVPCGGSGLESYPNDPGTDYPCHACTEPPPGAERNQEGIPE